MLTTQVVVLQLIMIYRNEFNNFALNGLYISNIQQYSLKFPASMHSIFCCNRYQILINKRSIACHIYKNKLIYDLWNFHVKKRPPGDNQKIKRCNKIIRNVRNRKRTTLSGQKKNRKRFWGRLHGVPASIHSIQINKQGWINMKPIQRPHERQAFPTCRVLYVFLQVAAHRRRFCHFLSPPLLSRISFLWQLSLSLSSSLGYVESAAHAAGEVASWVTLIICDKIMSHRKLPILV